MVKNPKAIVIDSLLSQCYDQGIFNGVALVADEGAVILHKSYGIADFKSQTPLERSDRFYIGSLTKQFTSALILLLQEQELINISDAISKHLSEFDHPEYNRITIHQLLTHTSGLANYTSFPDFDRSKDYSESEFLAFIKRPLLFEPGSSWSYSNTAYYILGLIAQKTCNKTYSELLAEMIFDPLKMHNTAYEKAWLYGPDSSNASDAADSKVAKGFLNTIDGLSPMPTYSLSSLFSSGGIYSTAENLFKWNQALYTNQLLSDASKSILFTPVKNDYACGWYVKKGFDDEGEIYERHFHGGMIKGYHAFILRRIPSKQVVILLDNSYSQELQTIKNRIWSALIEEQVKEIKPKLSKLLFEACGENTILELSDSISNNIEVFEQQFTFEEFDINAVAYRLMEAERFLEADEIFKLNIALYPESWNVYDSMGELRFKQGKFLESEELYKKSLKINPNNISAKNALEAIKLMMHAPKK